MRYLGIDYGKKRVGLALGERGLVFPLVVYPQGKNIFDQIRQICVAEKVDRVVLGFSQDLKKEIKIFFQKLKNSLDLPIIIQNEALTTREAADKMLLSSTRRKDRRERIDAVAAAQILAAYFDSHSLKKNHIYLL
ncbi:MAG: Holliday junction resolvase RuvX, partial [Candidatus Shapirobacteria bacterium]|nr:Holliday junction resolvase RuvX [Candidatus Shapirobacteria bacterium]